MSERIFGYFHQDENASAVSHLLTLTFRGRLPAFGLTPVGSKTAPRGNLDKSGSRARGIRVPRRGVLSLPWNRIKKAKPTAPSGCALRTALKPVPVGQDTTLTVGGHSNSRLSAKVILRLGCCLGLRSNCETSCGIV